MDEKKQESMKFLPKIDELLTALSGNEVCKKISKNILKKLCQQAVATKRKEIATASKTAPRNDLTQQIISEVISAVQRLITPQLQKVINATGVILHTNLGRAPLCEDALYSIVDVAEGYSNLEFALETGKRGSRYDSIKEAFYLLTGAEDVVVVNNNAAAVLLTLESLGKNKEAIISRGELVEIGGEFRIPDVMEKSGALLKEVGTTNRTRISDYENAITENTGLILKVHTSNFKIVGFTEEATIEDLVALGKRHNITVVYDLGSGCLIDLSRYGISSEPLLATVVASGVDVVTISGDKLLGGPQSGIILGKSKFIDAIRSNPLNRALRIDKLTLAALEATITQYLHTDDVVLENIVALKYISRNLATLKKNANSLLKQLRAIDDDELAFSVAADISFAGGGTIPGTELETIVIRVRHVKLSPESIADRLRNFVLPVVARIANNEVLFDLRTLEKEDFPVIAAALEMTVKAHSLSQWTPMPETGMIRQSSTVHRAPSNNTP